MEIRFTRSARKHRIGKLRALEVISNHEPREIKDERGNRLLWIGQDQRGLELEIVGIELDEAILIIHVMPFRYRRKGGESGK